MSLKDVVAEYYKKENNCSCAEAMIKGCNDYYGMNLPKECFLASSGFSKGMYGGHICGAVASGAAVISILTSTGYAHDSTDMRTLITKLNKVVIERLQSNKCVELHTLYHNPEQRCAKAVGAIADIVEEIIHEAKENGQLLRCIKEDACEQKND